MRLTSIRCNRSPRLSKEISQEWYSRYSSTYEFTKRQWMLDFFLCLGISQQRNFYWGICNNTNFPHDPKKLNQICSPQYAKTFLHFHPIFNSKKRLNHTTWPRIWRGSLKMSQWSHSGHQDLKEKNQGTTGSLIWLVQWKASKPPKLKLSRTGKQVSNSDIKNLTRTTEGAFCIFNQMWKNYQWIPWKEQDAKESVVQEIYGKFHWRSWVK